MWFVASWYLSISGLGNFLWDFPLLLVGRCAQENERKIQTLLALCALVRMLIVTSRFI